MKKSYYLAAVVLGLLITTATVSLTTFAAANNSTANNNKWQKQNDVRQAIQDNNYTEWKTAMDTKVLALRQQADDLSAKINEDTFNKLVQAHQLMADGKTQEAQAIFKELGMGGMGKGLGMGGPGRGGMMGGHRENQTQGNPQ